MDLIGPRIPRLTSIVDGPFVPVENGCEATWALDDQGGRWVRKRESNTGCEPLLAEAIAWLLGRLLGVRQPDAAVFDEKGERSWMSGMVPSVGHWTRDMRDYVENLDEVAAMLVLDALVFEEDRHARNILVQPLGDEVHLRLWAIDSGNALVGHVSEFIARGLDAPSPHNHARGLPIDVLGETALVIAGRSCHLEERVIHLVSVEACSIAREPRIDDLSAALARRCRAAPEIVAEYLHRLEALR